MKTLVLKLSEVFAGDRLREIDEDWAATLAGNMSIQGQMTPIEVRPTPDKVLPYALVAGAHRLRALEINGAETVTAILFEGDALAAKLREIDENLMRHELTALDRATFLAERKAVYEALHPQTKQGGDRRPDQTDNFVRLIPSFSASTAERLGFDERTIRRAVRRHAVLHPDLRRRLAGTWLADHGQQLDHLGAIPRAEQLQVVELLLAPAAEGETPPKTVQEAHRRLLGTAELPRHKDDDMANKIMLLWRRASPKSKRAVIRGLGREFRRLLSEEGGQ